MVMCGEDDLEGGVLTCFVLCLLEKNCVAFLFYNILLFYKTK